MKGWTADRSLWPPSFSRQWLWTMGSEPSGHARVIKTAQAVGATDVVALLNDSPVHQPRFGLPKRQTTLDLASKLRDVGIDFHLGSWLDPSKQYVDAAAVALAELAELTKAKSICLDAEGEWRKRISNHLEFVAAVVSPAFAGFPTPIGITSFAGLPKEVAPLLAWAVADHKGYGQPQAYAVWQGKEWQKNAGVQPDKITALAYRTWSPFTTKLVILLAAYGEVHPGTDWNKKGKRWEGKAWTIASALETSLQRAEYDGYPEFGTWSEEALRGGSHADKIRIEVLSEVEITGKSKVLASGSLVPVVLGLGAAAIGAGVAVWKYTEGS